jgi:hypothetical protein
MAHREQVEEIYQQIEIAFAIEAVVLVAMFILIIRHAYIVYKIINQK